MNRPSRGQRERRIIMAQRKHVAAQKRSVRREVHISNPSKFGALETRILAGAAGSPSQNVSQREATALVRQIVESLPQADRDVLQMRLVDDLPFADIAVTLKIEPATVRKRFGRAMLKLSVKLKAAGLSKG
ncbi:MAG TPA: sigma-70 family RNA polymerase sigma factor [Pirellulales bacterium]|nr:sigma-70 family RNA polymerase sigma factor [Pirellulales bacterium]